MVVHIAEESGSEIHVGELGLVGAIPDFFGEGHDHEAQSGTERRAHR